MKNGFTFIEMMVSVAIFVLIVSAASGIFVSSLRAQKKSLDLQGLLDQTSYFMEYASRALRMAKKDIDGSCTGAAKLNYSFFGQCLNLRTYKDACQKFCLEGQRLRDKDYNYLTSEDIKVLGFKVYLAGATQNDNLQPLVTIFLEAEGKQGSKIKLQTSVSQRNADVQK